MRVWDIHPGYLSRARLLGEHREIHAVWVVITEEKKGYAAHPETMRWRGHLLKLYRRHALVVAEMDLRGYKHKSPLLKREGEDVENPLSFVDSPHTQFLLLAAKYGIGEMGRIPLPKRGYDFWAHHKYSVMARGYDQYKEVSRLSQEKGNPLIGEAQEIVEVVYRIMQEKPKESAAQTTWEHVLGYFKEELPSSVREEWLHYIPEEVDLLRFLVYREAKERGINYIERSTLLADPAR